jgi:hypothetical protein
VEQVGIMSAERIDGFIRRWASSGASERANCQLFLSELCGILDVPRPDPTVPDDTEIRYLLERAVTLHHGDCTISIGRIGLYWRDCFVLEAEQGVEQQDGEAALSAASQPQGQSRVRNEDFVGLRDFIFHRDSYLTLRVNSCCPRSSTKSLGKQGRLRIYAPQKTVHGLRELGCDTSLVCTQT